jgi:hypothetical protein
MAIFDKISGISTGSGFKYQSEYPLDARLVVDYYSELAELVAAAGAYVGMLVYVKNETSINTATYPKGYYSYDGITWTEFKGTDTAGDYNVQADWNETNTASDAFIKNKPTIPTNTNQTVKTGSVTFGADDVVEFVAGSNVSISGDATNKKITISSTDTNTDTIKAEVENQINNLISSGMEDPSASITSQYYFKYKL